MLTSVFIACALAGNPNPSWDDSWEAAEAPFLTGHTQLTDESEFLKAGESYFSPDGRLIVFQGIERDLDEGESAVHYAMYVAPVRRNRGSVTGLGNPIRLSEPGSSNTCGWFHPQDYRERHSYTLLYGTTTTPPDSDQKAGYQRGTSRYSWQFPNEMEIVVQSVKRGSPRHIKTIQSFGWKPSDAEPMWEREGYDAEASWSPDGRHVLYTRLKPNSDDGDLWIFDTQTGVHTELIAERGYDGGPFFSPDGGSICYRSDRRGDKLLQVFVARLAFGADGAITGIEREVQITDNEHVNWAPFFTPDGNYLFYASSEVSHGNYEVFCVKATGNEPPSERPTLRITHARGFDGLPVFTPDGTTMMWTAQRGAQVEGETRPSSQLWAADVDLEAVDAAYRALLAEQAADSFDDYVPDGVGP